MKSMPIFEKREEINHKNYNYNKSISTEILSNITDADNENKTTINNIIKDFQGTASINEDLYETYTHDNFFPIHGKKYMLKTYYNNTKLELESFKVINTIYDYALSEISK